MINYYILGGKDDHEAVPSDFRSWAQWLEDTVETALAKGVDVRRVAETTVGNSWVSTVFFGMNLNLRGSGPPQLFETMVFGKDGLGRDCYRTATWDEALATHQQVVAELRRGKRNDDR